MNYFGHYTSMKGLVGILQEESLWATNIKYLNDEHEFQHAIDLFKNIIPQHNISHDDKRFSLYSEYEKRITESLDSLDEYKSESVFTLSFSEEPDLLSQWRGYCPNHNGYCLVFDASKIYDDIVMDYQDVYFLACVYDEEEKNKLIRSTLNEWYLDFIKCNSDKEKEKTINGLTKQMIKLAAQFKHFSFREEKEHRIIIVQDYDAENEISFREGRTSLIPYLKIPSKKQYIQRIIIGPTENRALALRGLQSFVEKIYKVPAFLCDIHLEFSKSPYRPW